MSDFGALSFAQRRFTRRNRRNAISKPLQDLLTEYCWGAAWGREVLLQVAVYAGAPAAADGFRVAREAFAELDAQ